MIPIARSRVHRSAGCRVQGTYTDGEANVHSGPEEAGHTGPAEEQPGQEDTVQVIHRQAMQAQQYKWSGQEDTVAMAINVKVTISFPASGVFCHLGAIMSGKAAHSAYCVGPSAASHQVACAFSVEVPA